MVVSRSKYGLYYHGCATRYSDGTNEIIEKGEKCLIPTNKCFWKDPIDVLNAVITRFQLLNQSIAHWKTIHRYFEQSIKRIIDDSLVNFEEKMIEIVNEPFTDQCLDKEQKNCGLFYWSVKHALLFLLLTTEIFFQAVEGDICRENTTRCNLICLNILY